MKHQSLSRDYCSTALFTNAEDAQKQEHAQQLGGDAYRQGRSIESCPYRDELLIEHWKAGYNDQKDFWENSLC